ncbi:MAG TPA: hypothetical protein DEA69_11220 [Microbacterium sp.]|uniref:hypothetical protein n=1 Tax=unclassified Microbacterium TaxID=2609290 RepID=UPI000C4F143A|nr:MULTISPECIES: hypothetical protein [unclassified Microbacterium]MBU18907.1 hypothetical protein [Microbacterium sp.]HBS09354.1 hypothetical protein [Microbacterium sp.]HBU43144.1 hypothetical protein [Microbacterium sp.]
MSAASAVGAGVSRRQTALAIPLLGIMGGVQTADPTIASTALVESARALQMDAGLQAIAASVSTLMLAATVISTGLLADRIGRRVPCRRGAHLAAHVGTAGLGCRAAGPLRCGGTARRASVLPDAAVPQSRFPRRAQIQARTYARTHARTSEAAPREVRRKA